jgi:hypothetical protein
MKFSFVELAKGLDLFTVKIPDNEAVVFEYLELALFAQAVIASEVLVKRYVRQEYLPSKCGFAFD